MLVPAVALLVLAAAATACGSTDQSGVKTDVTSTTAPAAPNTAPATETTSQPTSAAAPTTKAPGTQAIGGPVPSGFDPVSFTAVSDGEYWLLGEAPCHNPVCTSIVRTTDGGARFVGLPAPTSALDVGNGSSGAINTLRFADALDGYAYDTNPGGAFWDTHDGGEHWAQPSFLSGRTMLAFGTGGGYAFALVGSCPNGTCSGVALVRSPVVSDQWAPLSVPVPSGVSQVATMTVHGSDLWFSLTTGASQPNQLLVAGTGSGARFTTYKSPCLATLAGTLQATSANVLWAACPSGTMGEALRSADGGAHWQQLATGELENSAVLAPASDSTAVLEPVSQGELLRTTDGGTSWKTVLDGTSGGYWSWIGFTDSSTGSALQVESKVPAGWPWPGGPAPEQLWRTTDGGTTWSGPVSIG